MADRRGQVDDATIARLRLEALGLPVAPPGWVPQVAPDVRLPPSVAASPSVTASDEPPAHGAAPSAPTIDGMARAWVQDRVPVWAHGMVEQVRVRVVLVVVAALVAMVVGVVVLMHHGSGGGYPSSYDASVAGSPAAASPQPSAAPLTSASSVAASVVVDVGGRVRKPGLVTLPSGARVADALAAAGGPLHQREVATLNLAARVTDGELLLVGVKGAAVGASAADGSTDGAGATGASPAPVDLNAATIEELETLPGVGPATAQKIIDWRTASNGFTSVSQLQQVPGIGPVKYAELSPLVTP